MEDAFDAIGTHRNLPGVRTIEETTTGRLHMHDQARGTLLEEPAFEHILHRLVGYEHEEGILSVYLDLDPATVGGGFGARLTELWKPLREQHQVPWLAGRMEYEIEGVTAEVDGWRQAPGRSAAIFFSGPAGLRTVVPLRFPVRSLARFEPQPVLAPLIAALDEHRRFCVVAFDRAHARLITVSLGSVEDEVTLTSDVPAKSDVGGWGGYLQGRYARHRERHLVEHASRTIEHLWSIDRKHPLHSLILSGPDESLAVLRRMLPSALARIVAGVIPGEMFAATAEIVRHVTSLEEDAREREDASLVSQALDEARSGGAGTAGWAETLQALGEARVQVLLLRPNAPRAGVECPHGHFLALEGPATCPMCDARLLHTRDIAEAAVHAAMQSDARVRFLAPNAARSLEPHGAAALLRY